MKKLSLILLSATIMMLIKPFKVSSQVVDEKSETYILSNKQAQSQTKAMAMLLVLNEKETASVDKINLKYQLMTNSLRESTASAEERKVSHASITEQKNAELKSTLSEEQYNKYIQGLEKAKAQLYERINKKPWEQSAFAKATADTVGS